MQVARAHTPTLIPDPELELEPDPELVLKLELVLVLVLVLPVPVPPPAGAGASSASAGGAGAGGGDAEAGVDAAAGGRGGGAGAGGAGELQVPRAHTLAWIPPPLVAVWAVVRVTAAGGGLVPGGDSAAWAAAWLSRNIPLAPAARMRPRWMMFMTGVSLHR